MELKEPDSKHSGQTPPDKHGPLRALFSVLAGFFGVQSSANLANDEANGNPGHFILAGLLATVALVVFIVVFVKVLIAVST